MDWNEDDFKHSNTRGQIAGTAAKAAAATFVKYLRTLLSIGWHLLGYLFEGVMVLFTIIAATFDLFLGWAWVALGEWDRGTEFVFTYSYKEWLNQTYNLAFETEDGRRQRNKIKKAERLQRRTLFEKAVTNGLLKSATEKSLDVSKLDSNSCVVFVFTDIQGSTEAQVQSARAYQEAVLKHDITLREVLYSHRGLELDTEGDAFQLLFSEVVDAVNFCMEFQETMLHVKWPKKVTQIKPFAVVRDPSDNQIIFAGPRVRMGIHMALPGTFDIKVNQVTHKPVFSGLSWDLAKHLGDIGSGGQVIVSDTAWSVMQNHLAALGFPFVKHLGEFQLEAMPDYALDIFEVSMKSNGSTGAALVGRKFDPLRRCEQTAPERPFGVVNPPTGEVAFVAIRASQYEVLETQPSMTSFRVDKNRPDATKGGAKMMAVSEGNTALLVSTIQGMAQWLQGFRFKIENQRDECLYISFDNTIDACRFCIALQVTLLCSDWPDEPKAQFVGQNIIYRGPTVSCAIHAGNTEGTDFFSLEDAISRETLYAGRAVEALQSLLDLTHPGQILLSEKAWREVKFRLGELNMPTVIDCGVHQVGDAMGICQIVELLDRTLKGRVFDPIDTGNVIAPGARMSPYASDGVAFVFTYPVIDGCHSDGTRESQLVDDAVSVFVGMTRQIVYAKDPNGFFFGYECQEVGPGNFMLAFRSMNLAMSYCQKIQERLLTYKWDRRLTKLPSFQEGLKVKLGCGSGIPSYSMPHPSTGRADYFGEIVNLVARTAQRAAPGQCLVALKVSGKTEKGATKEKTTAILARMGEAGFDVRFLKKRRLRGITNPVALAELVVPPSGPMGWTEDAAEDDAAEGGWVDYAARGVHHVERGMMRGRDLIDSGLAHAEHFLSKSRK